MTLPTAIVLAAAMFCTTVLVVFFTAVIWGTTHHS
jgi:hypothetical protein